MEKPCVFYSHLLANQHMIATSILALPCVIIHQDWPLILSAKPYSLLLDRPVEETLADVHTPSFSILNA